MKFNFEGPFFTGLGKVIDCMLLSALWLLLCLPLFTIGPATTALYYTVHKSFVRGRGYMFQSFFHSFKDNFKQSLSMCIVFMIIGGILGIDLMVTTAYLSAGSALGYLTYVFLVFVAAVIIWFIYTFAYTARFENDFKNTLKNAGILAISNLPWSLLILLIFAVGLLLVVFLPFTIVFVPVGAVALFDLILERIFRKYMSEEDLEQEQENDKLDDK